MKLRVYNKTLDPNLWNNDKTLKPEIKDTLLKIAEDFYKTTDLKGDIYNVLMLGSSVNYNWTPSSDIDVHVVIDIASEKINPDYARKFMEGLTYRWNSKHNIEVKGHPVEIYLQDISEPNSTAKQARPGAAIYSLYDDKWALEPTPQKINLDPEKIKKKFQKIKKQIQELIDTENIDNLKSLMKSIANYRNSGLASGGEFSVENIVFKALRHSGDLKKLKDAINRIYDKKASLPETGNIIPDKKTLPLVEEYINESNIDSGYLIIGLINKNLEIIAKDDSTGRITHQYLLNKQPEFKNKETESWIYRSLNNVLYWSDDAPTKHREAVLNYLKDVYNVQNPPQKLITLGNYSVAHTPSGYRGLA